MIHTNKVIFKKILELSDGKAELLCIKNGNSIVKYRSQSSSPVIDCKKYEGQLQAIIQQLVNDGFLEVPYRNTFQLTDKGLHYLQYSAEELKSFFLRSVATPIVVSVITAAITTIITLWLQGLLV